jgi:serine/threonine protein kinase
MKPFFSAEVSNLILRLLDKDPDTRLGSASDADEVMQHPFFADVDWPKLERKEVVPLFKPDLTGDRLKYFNPNLDKPDRGAAADDDGEDLGPYQSLAGFSYTNDSFKERRQLGSPDFGEIN